MITARLITTKVSNTVNKGGQRSGRAITCYLRRISGKWDKEIGRNFAESMIIGAAAILRPACIIWHTSKRGDRSNEDNKGIIIFSKYGLPEDIPAMLTDHVSKDKREERDGCNKKRELILEDRQYLRSFQSIDWTNAEPDTFERSEQKS
jgi:hypothetical protein